MFEQELESCLESGGGRLHIKKGLKTGLGGGSLQLWGCGDPPALSYPIVLPWVSGYPWVRTQCLGEGGWCPERASEPRKGRWTLPKLNRLVGLCEIVPKQDQGANQAM